MSPGHFLDDTLVSAMIDISPDSMFGRIRNATRMRVFEDLLVSFTPSERLALYAFSTVLAISTLVLLARLNESVSVTIPARAGNMTEGITGTPRFVNPVLAMSQTDTDIGALVFSGLMRATPEGGLIPDLASSYQLSPDGLRYSFTLRSNAMFQDGTAVTPADILYTIDMIKNPDVRSPRRADWEGVDVSSPDAHTVVFTLSHPYAPFLENTTLGILPKHLWEKVTPSEFAFSTLNTHPIGSGPYALAKATTDSTGAATEYEFQPFDGFTLGSPHLSHLFVKFYNDDSSLISAFKGHDIDSVGGVSPADIPSASREQSQTLATPLPRIFGVFFNQSHAPVLADLAARAALDAAVDKRALVADVLKGYGEPLDGPVVPEYLGATSSVPSSASSASTTANARAILQKGGWTFDTKTSLWMKNKKPLSLTLATADTPDLKASAEFVAVAWRAVGVRVDVHVYSLTELNTAVIRPRAYDALLFGEVEGRTLDLFAFWHSSQRVDPGLNLALYANAKADALLSNARTALNRKDRSAFYQQFSAIVAKDHPAVFLFAPAYTYVIPDGIHGVAMRVVGDPSDRFLNVYQWYTDTEHVWSFFAGTDTSSF